MKERLADLEDQMTTRQLAYAKAEAAGKTPNEAAKIAGYASPDAPRKNAKVMEYVRLSREIIGQAALDALEFTEVEWLREALDALKMAKGEKSQRKVAFADGMPTEVQVKEVNLTAMNKTLELLARRYGLLTDNKKLSGDDGISFNLNLSGKLDE